ncbi:MAG: phosphoribosylanthranilate isomerase [Deltaproteobacteria bacterium HGW-Deltaproteobacteria-8]|jgi:phosphoribosylanthranilate isomerase|nr:MAG: phosphoribosylanthranilate isomerase [Deltaproteobacteria bacterium HGW-Deltaproteobacteria-8]
MLAACGVTHVGLPLRLPVHTPDVSEDQARDIVRGLAGAAKTVLITYLQDAAETLKLCRYLGVDGVQLHGAMPVAEVRRLREAAPALFVIKSLVVGLTGREEGEAGLLAEAQAHTPFVDAFLTDTFDPVSGASGATGKAHDWAISRRLAQTLDKPLILAGGLNADNVARAIAAVRPAGVDAHTGLENAFGDKDEVLVRRFVAEAARALAAFPPRPGLAKARDSA